MDDATADAYLARIGATREPPVGRRPCADADGPAPDDGAVREPEHPSRRDGSRSTRTLSSTRSSPGAAAASATSSTAPSRCCSRHLGYDVTLLAARVYGDAGPGPLFDHLTLRVDVDQAPWLVDVGFGRFVVAPVPARRARRPARPGRRRPGRGDRTTATSTSGSTTSPQLRVEQRPRALADFAPTCWYQQTSPDSHFTQSLTCSRPTGDDGRVTISDRLLITTVAGERTETTPGSDAEVLAAYREHFGFTLDRLPTAARVLSRRSGGGGPERERRQRPGVALGHPHQGRRVRDRLDRQPPLELGAQGLGVLAVAAAARSGAAPRRRTRRRTAGTRGTRGAARASAGGRRRRAPARGRSGRRGTPRHPDSVKPKVVTSAK